MTATASATRKRPRATRPAKISIQPKALGLKLTEQTPTVWYGGNPVLTNFMAGFFASFPRGERWMIKVVREFREQVRDDATLHKETSAFIGQEGHHATEHAVCNDFMASRGVPMGDVDGMVRWTIALFERHTAKQRLAIVGGAEHLTALFGELTLAHPQILEQVHPDVRPLFIWHAIEELEHKAVTYDLYEALDGSYARRVYGYSLLTGLFMVFAAMGTLKLSIADRSIFKPRATAGALWWMFGAGKRGGYIRRDVLPRLLEFYRPGFHPWDRDDSHLIEQWRPVLERMLHDARTVH
jgi:predicted metal-dependent hydrolase